MTMVKFTVETTTVSLDAGAAVDKGGGLVGIPSTAHGLSIDDWITLNGTTNYDQLNVATGWRVPYQLDATTTVNELVIEATFVSETFATTDSASRKLFIAKAGIIEYDVPVDLYSDAKEHWLAGGTIMGFPFPFSTVGGEEINPDAGTSVPFYGFLEDGWRIRPDEADHTVDVVQGILLVKGGGDPFVDTLGAFTVRIRYQQPVQAITVTVETSTGGLTISEFLALKDA